MDTPGLLPPVVSGDPIAAQGKRLVALDALGDRGVVEVETEAHGTLAVGMAEGEPFAVSNLCRHQYAKLGRGRVDERGRLVCPWHRACYDVRDGRMVEGPQGRIFGFKPYSKAFEAVGRAWRLTSHPVEVRGGAIWLR